MRKMRKFYFLLAIGVILAISLLALSFLFLAKEKHNVYFYGIEDPLGPIGYVKIDSYQTENKIIYKSSALTPRLMDKKLVKEKAAFSRKSFTAEKFLRETKNYGSIVTTLNIKYNHSSADYLGASGSKFITVSGLACKNNSVLFDPLSPLTYLPFIKKYDFSRGGSQSFNALYVKNVLFPPVNGKIVFTSIKDEYISVLGHKEEVECLIVKSKAMPEIRLWVSKRDKSIARIEIKMFSIVMDRLPGPVKLDVNSYSGSDPKLKKKEILFPSGDIALSGTLVLPDGLPAKAPGVLLVCGNGPYNRQNAGMYTDLSEFLAANGYVTLFFDKRGMGSSQGNYAGASLEDSLKDVENALSFLVNQENVDASKTFIITHSSSCEYALNLAARENKFKGALLLSPIEPKPVFDYDSDLATETLRSLEKIDAAYAAKLKRAREETLALVKAAKGDYVFIHGKPVFIKRMRALLSQDVLSEAANVNTPITLLCGRKDPLIRESYIKDLENAGLRGETPPVISATYFRGLDHFLGDMVHEKDTVTRYKLNSEVMQTVKGWLDSKLNEDNLTNS